jgi:hypothetical protein
VETPKKITTLNTKLINRTLAICQSITISGMIKISITQNFQAVNCLDESTYKPTKSSENNNFENQGAVTSLPSFQIGFL